jgi:hypothetical protein
VEELGGCNGIFFIFFFFFKKKCSKTAGLLLLGKSEPVEVLQRRADSHVFQVRASWMPI